MLEFRTLRRTEHLDLMEKKGKCTYNFVLETPREIVVWKNDNKLGITLKETNFISFRVSFSFKSDC